MSLRINSNILNIDYLVTLLAEVNRNYFSNCCTCRIKSSSGYGNIMLYDNILSGNLVTALGAIHNIFIRIALCCRAMVNIIFYNSLAGGVFFCRKNNILKLFSTNSAIYASYAIFCAGRCSDNGNFLFLSMTVCRQCDKDFLLSTFCTLNIAIAIDYAGRFNCKNIRSIVCMILKRNYGILYTFITYRALLVAYTGFSACRFFCNEFLVKSIVSQCRNCCFINLHSTYRTFLIGRAGLCTCSRVHIFLSVGLMSQSRNCFVTKELTTFGALFIAASFFFTGSLLNYP